MEGSVWRPVGRPMPRNAGITGSPAYGVQIYDIMYRLSRRYIVLCEYYNPTPMEIPHREAKLYKRDFAGELMNRHPDVKLLDYGFQYHRDHLFLVDDYFWFVLEKR